MATRLGGLLMAAMLLAVPAAAQPPGDYGMEADSLGLAADAQPLQVERLWTECDPLGLRVVRDTAELRVFAGRRGCDASAFPGLGEYLYVHVQMGSDCHARFGVEAYRSESRREYRVVMVTWPGGCRAGGFESYWIRLPPLPEGWVVRFTDEWRDRDDSEPLDLGLRADSLGIPADTVRLAMERIPTECDPPGLRVVRDSADYRAIEHHPGCDPAGFPALGRDLYVRVVATVCGGPARVSAYRSESRGEYRLVIAQPPNRCRGIRYDSWWVRLPPLPEGWTVGFTDVQLSGGAPDSGIDSG